MSETPTPRTDAAAIEACGHCEDDDDGQAVVPIRSARALERELTAERATRERAEAERDALREDAERYRWLRYGDNDEPCLHFSNNCSAGTDTVWLLRNEQLDAAIDATRKERT